MLLWTAACPRAAPPGDVEANAKIQKTDQDRVEAECMADPACVAALVEVQSKTNEDAWRPELRRCFMTGLLVGAFEAKCARARDGGQFAVYGCLRTSALLDGHVDCQQLVETQLTPWAGPKGAAYVKAVSDLHVGTSDRKLFWYAFDGGYAYAWKVAFDVQNRPQRVSEAIHDGCAFAIRRISLLRRLSPDELSASNRNCDDVATDFVRQNHDALVE